MFLARVALLLLPFIVTVQGAYVGAFYTVCEQCVNGRYSNRARGVCSNICFAVVSGLRPSRLTISNNRAEDLGCSACRNRSPCGAGCVLPGNYKRTGDTCDEYPFASTLQSGRRSGTPAVLRCVPRTENSSGGSQYQTFKSRHRAGDTFDAGVSYFPSTSLKFCNPRSRTNDGTEFRYFGGGIANYRNARDLVVSSARFVAAEAGNATIAVIPSLYKTNHGDLFVAFTHLEVGTPTWNVRDGWGNVTEKVHENAFVYDEEYQKSNPVDKREADACPKGSTTNTIP